MRLETWEQFSAAACRFDDVSHAFKHNYVFRGQEDASWTLKTSLQRAATNGDRRPLPTGPELIEIEEALLNAFRATASDRLAPAVLQEMHHRINWWPVMRHYGVPTRLVDWTKSMYVAAYFAAIAAPDKDGAIYSLQIAALRRAMEGVHGAGSANFPNGAAGDRLLERADAAPVVYAVTMPRAQLDRVVAQQGIFLFSGDVQIDMDTTLTAEIPRFAEAGTSVFTKYIIPSALKPVIVRRLRAMNVVANSLFPGLDGIGRHLSDLVRVP